MDDWDWVALDEMDERNPLAAPPATDDADEIAALTERWPFEQCLTAAEVQMQIEVEVACEIAAAWERARALYGAKAVA